MTERISLDPDPPLAGESVRICYDFAGLGLTEVRLAVTFTPPPTTSFDTVTVASPCVDVEVPDAAEQITVADGSGTSPDKVAPVE